LCVTWTIAVEAAIRGTTRPVSVSSRGAVGRDDSESPSVSRNGRRIAFQSAADNLVPNDRNESTDVFVRDMGTGTTRLVSQSFYGEPGDGSSRSPAISADGGFVAFQSSARNLDAVDTNFEPDVYVRDLWSGTVELVSVSASHGAANGWSRDPAISGDGRYVAFESFASNLVAGDTNGTADVFVRDLVAGTTTRVSVSVGGAQASHASAGPAISGDGRFVAFRTPSPNLVPGDAVFGHDYFLRDLAADTTERVSVLPDEPDAFNLGGSSRPAISEDGRFVAFDTAVSLSPQDTDSNTDVYVRDRTLDTVERASAPLSGSVTDHNSVAPSISADGRYVCFYSGVSNLVDLLPDYRMHVYVRDRDRDATELVSLASNGHREFGEVKGGSISGDGLSVAFVSERVFQPGGAPRSQVYLRTRTTPQTTPRAKLEVRGITTFPTLAVGGTASRVVLLRNRGRGTLHGTVGGLTTPFYLTSGAGYFAIPAGGSYTVTVAFKPHAEGRFKADLTINVDGNPQTSRVLRCKGAARLPR